MHHSRPSRAVCTAQCHHPWLAVWSSQQNVAGKVRTTQWERTEWRGRREGSPCPRPRTTPPTATTYSRRLLRQAAADSLQYTATDNPHCNTAHRTRTLVTPSSNFFLQCQAKPQGSASGRGRRSHTDGDGDCKIMYCICSRTHFSREWTV